MKLLLVRSPKCFVLSNGVVFTNPVGRGRGNFLESGLLVQWPQSLSRSLLPTNLPLLSRRLQLPIPIGVNLLLSARQHVLWCDVAGGTVQANVVVMLDVALHQTPCIVQRQRRSRPDALSLERFVPAFDLS